MTTNLYIVQMTRLLSEDPYKLVGAYSSKEKADEAGNAAIEMLENGHFTVTIMALDDIINGVHKSEL